MLSHVKRGFVIKMIWLEWAGIIMMREYYLSALVATARRGEGTQAKQNKIFYSRVDRISRIKGIKIRSWHKSRVWQLTIHRMQDTGSGGDHDDTPVSMIVNTLLVAGEMVDLFSSSSALSVSQWLSASPQSSITVIIIPRNASPTRIAF